MSFAASTPAEMDKRELPVADAPSVAKQESVDSKSGGSGDAYEEKEQASESKEEKLAREQRERDAKLLTGMKLALVFLGMLSSVWLIALDQTILAPALPVIASRFNALSSLAWIASAYFLTQTAFLLLYGQILTCFDRKWTFMVAISLFEIGSIICAAAPNVDVLIFGRAFAGCGAAGIFVACLSIIADVTTLEQRPKLLGLFGGVFAISSVVGPLLGGAFTDKVTWRLCFWINVPFGVLTVVAIIFILPSQPSPKVSPTVAAYTDRKWKRWTFGKLQPKQHTFFWRLGVIDWWGAILILATITCLLLPLQWGGNEYPWDSGVVIGTFCAFGALAIIFALYEWKFAGETSILPLRLFKNRTQTGACLGAFFTMFELLVGTYYIPIYYQASRGVSATKSGVDLLPFMLAIVILAAVCGGLVSTFGRYWPYLFAGPFLVCIGSGLLFTIDEFTPNSKLIGYQILMGAGIGGPLQNLVIAVQADIEDQNDVAQATALVTFAQLVGGVIGISIGSTIFGVQLDKGLRQFAPSAPFQLVRNSVQAIRTLPLDEQPPVIHAYVWALRYVFIIGVAAGAFASLSAVLVRNKSVKGKNLMAGGA